MHVCMCICVTGFLGYLTTFLHRIEYIALNSKMIANDDWEMTQEEAVVP
jgi:hypothetical protein